MDVSIASNRICARMSGHQLCLDNPLPAVQKIVAQFLKHHPLIQNYKDCHFDQNPYGPIATITCSSDPYQVEAELEKLPGFLAPSVIIPKLIISLSKDGIGKFEALECDKNGCKARIYSGPSILFEYSFNHFPGGICSEVLYKGNTRQSNNVPCDGRAIRFDEYLKHSTFSLGVPQPIQPPQPPAGQTWGVPSASGSAAPGSSTPQNQTSFSSLPTVLGVASTIFCLYKTYKELEKIDEEGQKEVEASRLKGKAGQAGSADSKNTASGWKALGYLTAAIAAGVFTYYSIRA